MFIKQHVKYISLFSFKVLHKADSIKTNTVLSPEKWPVTFRFCNILSNYNISYEFVQGIENFFFTPIAGLNEYELWLVE